MHFVFRDKLNCLFAVQSNTFACLACGFGFSSSECVEERRNDGVHHFSMTGMVGVIDIIAVLIAVSPLSVALTVIYSTKEVNSRDVPLMHLKVHLLNVSIVGSIVIATGIVVGSDDNLAFVLTQFGEFEHVGFPLVVDALRIGSAMDTFVAQAQTDDYELTAITIHMTFVAREEVKRVVAVDRRVATFVLGQCVIRLMTCRE